MRILNQVFNGSAVVSRLLLMSVIWWALTDGSAESWWIGVPAVACATIVSVVLVPTTGLVWWEVLRFIPFFLWYSLKGGVDVARRALHPRMPIMPEIIEYPLRLPHGLPQVMLMNAISLLPGTLSVDFEGRMLKIHVLDGLDDFLPELEALERHVGRMLGSTLVTFRGGE